MIHSIRLLVPGSQCGGKKTSNFLPSKYWVHESYCLYICIRGPSSQAPPNPIIRCSMDVVATCSIHLLRAVVWRWQGHRLGWCRKPVQRLHPWHCSTRGQNNNNLPVQWWHQLTPQPWQVLCNATATELCVCNSTEAIFYSFDLFCLCMHKKCPVWCCCELQWQHLAALAGIELHCGIAPHKKIVQQWLLQHACKG